MITEDQLEQFKDLGRLHISCTLIKCFSALLTDSSPTGLFGNILSEISYTFSDKSADL
jgi:hypothetical protein